MIHVLSTDGAPPAGAAPARFARGDDSAVRAEELRPNHPRAAVEAASPESARATTPSATAEAA